jgi:hypothetical protein
MVQGGGEQKALFFPSGVGAFSTTEKTLCQFYFDNCKEIG